MMSCTVSRPQDFSNNQGHRIWPVGHPSKAQEYADLGQQDAWADTEPVQSGPQTSFKSSAKVQNLICTYLAGCPVMKWKGNYLVEKERGGEVTKDIYQAKGSRVRTRSWSARAACRVATLGKTASSSSQSTISPQTNDCQRLLWSSRGCSQIFPAAVLQSRQLKATSKTIGSHEKLF